jgi:hypothetical protein
MMTSQSGPTWERIPPRQKKLLIWVLWFITWLGLVLGVFEPVYFEFVVTFSALHALLFLTLFQFKARPFPVQVRLAYFIWVAVGTYVPYMLFLMYITLVGLATNLFLGYCPLARMMNLLPWNRQEKLSLDLFRRVYFSSPVSGRFKPPPPAAQN